jgi:ectoine hydroxylase-related dioxygenase (phytanoyl-CoA dioxygenase family)
MISTIKQYMSRPTTISAYGRNRFFFYNHEENGASCLNPISQFANSEIKKQIRNPIPPKSETIYKVQCDLNDQGIALFDINQIHNGTDLLARISKDCSQKYELERDAINNWLKDQDRVTKIAKQSFRHDIALDPSLDSPGWQLAIHPDILAVVNSYLSAYCRIWYTSYWLSIPLPNQQQAPVPAQLWHRDGDGTVIKLFLYLNDVSTENGAFCYAAGTHKGRDRRLHGLSSRLQNHEMESLFSERLKITEASGKAGTIILANTSAYHKGGYVRSGSRLLFTVSYFCPWIKRADYKTEIPKKVTEGLHPAQVHALGLKQP